MSVPKRIICVASTEELLNIHYYCRLWLAASSLNLDQRPWCTNLIEACQARDITVIRPCGQPYTASVVKGILVADLDLGWLRSYLCEASIDTRPYRLNHTLERLRIVDLYFRLCHPQIAAHFIYNFK